MVVTENGRKRKSRDEHGGQARNVAVVDSTEPFCPNVVKRDGVVTMPNHQGNNAGLGDGGEQPDPCQGGWQKRKKRNGVGEGDRGESSNVESESESLCPLAPSRMIALDVVADARMLNPVLWGTLPEELVFLILARLPVRDLIRLRYLSRAWARDMDTVNSEINQACDEASPNMVALISTYCEGGFQINIRVTIVDLSKHKSPYSYTLSLGNPNNCENGWAMTGARDGGLVCFVSTWKPSELHPLCIVVMNPLTQVLRELPCLHDLYNTPPTMVHLKVDSKTKSYTVVVVGEHLKGLFTTEIYNSSTNQWTKAAPPYGSIFGIAYKWEYSFHSTKATFYPYAYDFTDGQLKCCSKINASSQRAPTAPSTVSWAHGKDCLFVLQHKPVPTDNTSEGEMQSTRGFSIAAYSPVPSSANQWVQGETYLCPPFNAPSSADLFGHHVKACEGFLVAGAQAHGSSDCLFWFLDLSSGQWSDRPQQFEKHKCGTSMCRALWNVVP